MNYQRLSPQIHDSESDILPILNTTVKLKIFQLLITIIWNSSSGYALLNPCLSFRVLCDVMYLRNLKKVKLKKVGKVEKLVVIEVEWKMEKKVVLIEKQGGVRECERDEE